MPFAIRPIRVPDDFESVAELLTLASWDRVTAAGMAAAESAFPAQGIRHRLVAATEDGTVSGYGVVLRRGAEPPGRFLVNVVVDPGLRRQGVGSALLDRLEGLGRERSATQFECRFRDDDAAGLPFALHHGYAEAGHHQGAMLDLTAFDETPFAGVISRLEAQGIRFGSMASAPGPAFERSVYELVREASQDEPGFETEPFPPYEQWQAETLRSPGQPLDLIIVATDGHQPVGFTHIAPTGGGTMRTHFTCVHRRYRGRSIALAVKLLVIRAARRHGALWLKTGSDVRNTSMIAINRQLSYQYMPGMYRCLKP